MHQVRRGEVELDRHPLVDDPDELSVGGVLGQEMPADRDTAVDGQDAGHLERRWPGAIRPHPRTVDRARIAGERTDECELVDDAAEEDVGVEAPERAAAASPRASRWSA